MSKIFFSARNAEIHLNLFSTTELFFILLLFIAYFLLANVSYAGMRKDCLQTCYDTCHDCNYCAYECYSDKWHPGIHYSDEDSRCCFADLFNDD